jgi:cellulose synthase (UDP-forming)
MGGKSVRSSVADQAARRAVTLPRGLTGRRPAGATRPTPPPALRRGPALARSHGGERVVVGWDRLKWWLIAAMWVAVNASFWFWWLRSAATPALFWPQTAALAYLTTALPTFFFYFVYRMRRPDDVPAPRDLRVAMITLCVPGHESLEVIRGQLESLARVTYEHDSWVLDEGASRDVQALAAEYGVRYFTRKGVERWNAPGPPFQRATKAGNVNAWLDHLDDLGVDYDVFVQLDIDHRPRPDYLDRVLGHFRDPKVAWVQAPSVGGNLDNWAARGLAEQDMLFQGPLQMGFYGATATPFIVGSHTSYRTTAVREIGGFQPTRAEDHLDTVVLAARGYSGVFVPELIAVGSGPHDFATYLRQQFAWAYSMIQILLHHTPRLLRNYRPAQAIQFLACQTWYAFWSLSMAVLWAIPTVALVLHEPIAHVTLPRFLVYFLPVLLVSTIMWVWARRWFQPAGLRLSWRGILLEIARWPVVLWALVNVLLRVKRPYMITPKGVGRSGGPRLAQIYGPYVALSFVPLAGLLVYVHSGLVAMRGYEILLLFNAAWGIVMLATMLVLEFRHIEAAAVGALRARAGILGTIALLAGALATSVFVAWHSGARPPW